MVLRRGLTMTPNKLFLCAFTVVCLCGLVWQKDYSVMDTEVLEDTKLEHSTIFSDRTSVRTNSSLQSLRNVSERETRLLLCPKKSPHLVGAIRENLANVTLDQVEKSLTSSKALGSYSTLRSGGHCFPKDCIARQKIAILIPFRNRHQHLHILLNNLVPVLRRQQIDFRIYVIEQEPGVTFNKGLLFNVGFITALSKDKFDCIVLHDVDCLPLNDNILYRCQDNPIHLVASGSKWNYKLPYYKYVGGALLMRPNQFININGFSNLYFGWGSEDDDLRIRIITRGYKILRYPPSIGRYYYLIHARDEGNAVNSVRMPLFYRATRRVMTEGLRSTVYKIRSIEAKFLYVWIQVSVNMTKVLQTAPRDARAVIKVLVRDGNKFDKMGLGHSEDGDKFKLPL